MKRFVMFLFAMIVTVATANAAAHRIQSDMENPRVFEGDGKIFDLNDHAGALFGWDDGTPSATGYAPGAIFIDTAAGKTYINKGSRTTSDWADSGGSLGVVGVPVTSFRVVNGSGTIDGDNSDTMKLATANNHIYMSIPAGGYSQSEKLCRFTVMLPADADTSKDMFLYVTGSQSTTEANYFDAKVYARAAGAADATDICTAERKANATASTLAQYGFTLDADDIPSLPCVLTGAVGVSGFNGTGATYIHGVEIRYTKTME